MEHKLFLLLTLLLISLISVAQSVVPASGGTGAGSGGSISFTVGQVSNNSTEGKSNYSIEGVQQPYEISVVNSLPELRESGVTLNAFPNPTKQHLKLSIDGELHENLSYTIYGMKGEILQSHKITSSETSLDLINYPTGTYLLKVLESTRPIKTFRIVKTN
jgi:hypothetical protein